MATIDTYFKEMKEHGASDLHMVIGFPPMIRLNGDLSPLNQPVLTPESNQDILLEMMTPEQQTEFKKKRDFDMAYELEDVGRFRCNFLYQHRGVGGVFRIIPTKILTLEQLGLPAAIKSIGTIKQGLVLVNNADTPFFRRKISHLLITDKNLPPGHGH